MSAARWVRRLLALGQARRLDRELDDEIAAHLEMAERDAVAQGHSPDEARRLARLRFGAVESVRESQREQRGLPVVEHIWRDARYAVSSLARHPGFAALTIGVLALGIGVTAVMFSLVDAVMLKPLPFPQAERIVLVREEPRPGATNATSTLDFLDWQRMATGFAALAAENPRAVTLSGAGGPMRVSSKAVTARYFDVFATPPLLGRLFHEDDGRHGATPVVVLSHAAWQTLFGGEPGILGRTLRIDGVPHQAVGVLPPGAFDREPADLWTPLVFGADRMVRETHWLRVFGRLREDTSLEAARQQMQAIDVALQDVFPVWKRDWQIRVEPLEAVLVGGDLREVVLIGFGAASLVLLIACANVANLLITRGLTRRRELAVRASLGASRGRLVAQLLTEGVVLCAFGGAAGVALAYGLLQAAQPLLGDALPFTADVRLDVRVLAAVTGIVVAVGLIVGIIPSLQTRLGALAATLSSSSRSVAGSGSTTRHVLVVAEVALSLVLVCASGLLIRTVLKLQQLDPGVRIEGVVATSADLPATAYPNADAAAQFYGQVVERVQAIPGVTRAGLATYLPLQWIANGEGVRVPGVDGAINVRFKRVDANYFDLLDVPVIAGRGITAGDRRGTSPVAVINEALAARLAEAAGVTNPLGRVVSVTSLDYLAASGDFRPVEIVGVIRSERVGAPWRPDPPVVYVPLAQLPTSSIRLLVRSDRLGEPLVAGVREALRQAAPELPIGDFETLEQVQARTYSAASRPAWVIGVFAVVATLLAALGLYAVLSHLVAQRTREIGVRLALGARAGDVVRHVLGSAALLLATGVVLGLAGVFAVTRVLTNLLYEVSPTDPVTIVAASATMATVGLAAALLPALRAAHVNPIVVLREEG
jgi:putative ABC transport system permease protein